MSSPPNQEPDAVINCTAFIVPDHLINTFGQGLHPVLNAHLPTRPSTPPPTPGPASYWPALEGDNLSNEIKRVRRSQYKARNWFLDRVFKQLLYCVDEEKNISYHLNEEKPGQHFMDHRLYSLMLHNNVTPPWDESNMLMTIAPPMASAGGEDSLKMWYMPVSEMSNKTCQWYRFPCGQYFACCNYLSFTRWAAGDNFIEYWGGGAYMRDWDQPTMVMYYFEECFVKNFSKDDQEGPAPADLLQVIANASAEDISNKQFKLLVNKRHVMGFSAPLDLQFFLQRGYYPKQQLETPWSGGSSGCKIFKSGGIFVPMDDLTPDFTKLTLGKVYYLEPGTFRSPVEGDSFQTYDIVADGTIVYMTAPLYCPLKSTVACQARQAREPWFALPGGYFIEGGEVDLMNGNLYQNRELLKDKYKL